MKLLRRWYWLSSGFLKKYRLGIFISLLIGVSAFLASLRLVPIMSFKPTYHLGRVARLQVNQLPLDIQYLLSTGLTKIEANGQVSLSAAQSMDVSPDGKTYTFTLKPGLTWSDGTLVNTADLELKPSDVTVETPTASTIIFTLKEPFAPFPSVVSQPLLKKVTTGRLWPRSRLIGLYQPVITDIQTKQSFVDQVRLEFTDKTYVYHFYPTEADSLTAFKLGQVDAITSLTRPYLTDWSSVVIDQTPQPNRYVALFFNTARPELQDKTVRQMLNYATPKDFTTERVISPIARSSWVYNPQVKPYPYQPQTAKDLLSKLQTSQPGYQPQFTLTTTPAYAQTAQAIAAAWADIGLVVDLKIVPFPDPTDYQIMLIGQQIPDDPDQYALWHSTQGTNISRYQNPKIDKLLEDGRKELNPQKRQEIYQEFQRFLVEDSPAVFLYTLPNFNLSRSAPSHRLPS
ncbi:hypothetical protein A2W24_02230 [Microgenomates group bacterium RBG_16_45_19]|nr:MAG: hypothetical protein A2W24_02230 [Microgenomates group bacterium RBG_16_45_19]